MGRVYAGSSLNLAATSSKNGEGGLFRTRSPALVLPCVSRPLSYESEDFIIYKLDLWPTLVNESPLGGRAWVLQERALARRTLHFGSNQLLWECSIGSACESYPWDPALAVITRRHINNDITLFRGSHPEHAWRPLVIAYSSSKLSFESEKLIAFAGIAKLLSDIGVLGTYVAGLWKDKLELHLLWDVSRSHY